MFTYEVETVLIMEADISLLNPKVTLQRSYLNLVIDHWSNKNNNKKDKE